MCPSGIVPRGPPRILTSLSRASIASTAGQGWFARHDPSISRAATPAIRTLGPSAHHIGPSPSHTAVGVQANVRPAGMMFVGAPATTSRTKTANTISLLEPGGDAAVMTAGTAMALTEAVCAVPATRGCSRRRTVRLHRPMDAISTGIDVIVRSAGAGRSSLGRLRMECERRSRSAQRKTGKRNKARQSHDCFLPQ